MQYLIRLLIALLTFIIGLTAVAILSSLRQSTPPPSTPSQSNEAISVALSPIEFFGWRHEKQSANQTESELLPSHTYRQLESWEAADESQSEQIDVVCHLENRGSRSVDVMVLAVGDFSISPDAPITRPHKFLPYPTILTERHNIGQQVIRALAPGETREVKFDSFSLKAMVDKYLRKDYGTLRPWELRVNIDVRTLDNKQVGQRQGRLRLNLGHSYQSTAGKAEARP